MFKRILSNLVPPSSGERFPALDGLRALAILGVLVCHASGQFSFHSNILRGLGGVGVVIFFMLSAFLLYCPIAKRQSLPRLRSYYWKRFSRIYPAYFVVLLLCIALIPKTREANFTSIIANLLMLQNYTNEWRAAINSYMWFLTPLMYFYLIFPLVAWLTLRTRWTLVGLFILSLIPPATGWRFVFLNHTMLTTFPAFAFGMAIAHLKASSYQSPRYLWFLGLAGLGIYSFLLWPAMQNDPHPLWGFRAILMSIFAFFLLLSLVGPPNPLTRILSSTPARVLGVLAYSIYLVHAIALHYSPLTSGPRFFLSLLLSVLIGALFYCLVEWPLKMFLMYKPGYSRLSRLCLFSAKHSQCQAKF